MATAPPCELQKCVRKLKDNLERIRRSLGSVTNSTKDSLYHKLSLYYNSDFVLFIILDRLRKTFTENLRIGRQSLSLLMFSLNAKMMV